jgi:DNA-binding MarR family transcriptional regulator
MLSDTVAGMPNHSRIASGPRATDTPGDRSPFALGLVLRRAHDRAIAAVSQALRPLGLETRHFAVLIALSGNGPMSQSALVEATGSDRATMVRVIDDLERQNVVTRTAQPGDRRVRIVGMTEHGTSVFDQAHVDAVALIGDLVRHLGPGEPEQLLDLLTRFAYPGRA